MPTVRDTFLFVHKTQIERYRRLLTTYLTVAEKQFFERRIGEEKKRRRFCSSFRSKLDLTAQIQTGLNLCSLVTRTSVSSKRSNVRSFRARANDLRLTAGATVPLPTSARGYGLATVNIQDMAVKSD